MNQESLRSPFSSEPEQTLLKESLPFRRSLGMGPYSVNIYSRIEQVNSFFDKSESYAKFIPGFKVNSLPRQSEYSIAYQFSDESSLHYDPETKLLRVLGKIEDFQDGQAFAYMTFWMTEAQRQRDGIVTAHAGAVSDGKKGVIILGERGDGKTSVCLGLGRRYGYKLMANDLTMVGFNPTSQKIEVHDGTKVFGLRLSAIRDRFDELLNLFEHTSKKSWTTKAFVSPEQIGMGIDNQSREIQKVYMVHVDSSKQDEFSADEMDDRWIRNYLYENFSRYIRGTAILAFGSESQKPLGYLPSLDKSEFHQRRVNLIEHMIDVIKIINVSSGDLKQIIDFIHSDIQSSSEGSIP